MRAAGAKVLGLLTGGAQGTISLMAQAVHIDRKATYVEVTAHADELRHLVVQHGYAAARLRSDGALIVHDDSVGYRRANRLAGAASQLVGAYVPVITDDAPAAEADAPDL